MSASDSGREERLAFTVGQVWREERVSCPHPHVLRSYLEGELSEGAAGFIRFHIEESGCDFCGSIAGEMAGGEEAEEAEELEGVRERLLRSTAMLLDRGRGGR